MLLKDVFVQACGWGVFPGVGFMVIGSGCLCRRLVVARGLDWTVELPLAGGDVTAGPAEIYSYGSGPGSWGGGWWGDGGY